MITLRTTVGCNFPVDSGSLLSPGRVRLCARMEKTLTLTNLHTVRATRTESAKTRVPVSPGCLVC